LRERRVLKGTYGSLYLCAYTIMSGMDPSSINGSNNVLPPYASNTDPQSFLSTGTYNASQYGAAWTDPAGTALSCSGKMIGGKGKKRPRFKMKSASRVKKTHKKRAHSKKKRIQVKRSHRRKTRTQ